MHPLDQRPVVAAVVVGAFAPPDLLLFDFFEVRFFGSFNRYSGPVDFVDDQSRVPDNSFLDGLLWMITRLLRNFPGAAELLVV